MIRDSVTVTITRLFLWSVGKGSSDKYLEAGKCCMRRIGLLTAGGDTPALNATIFGAVERANARRIEVFGIMDGFIGLLDPRLPHVPLNPLGLTIPELDPCLGGTLLGGSRAYLGPEDVKQIADRLTRLGIEGLICIGGDGTTNAMQCLSDVFPCVLAPKTIDNDLGLNFVDEPNDWIYEPAAAPQPPTSRKIWSRAEIALDEIVNYATPGYATAVYVVAQGIQRIRTTAESHRRIAIVEVMGRQTGHIALGSAYGQPDLILIPEVPLNLPLLVRRIDELYQLQKHVVIVVGEAIVDADGIRLGAVPKSIDPAGNIGFSGAAEALKSMLVQSLGDDFFRLTTHDKAESAIFTRKVGHTQRGGRPILFDRFYAAQLGGRAVDLLLEGHNATMATLQWSPSTGFFLASFLTNKLRDQLGVIRPRLVHPAFYDSHRLWPSKLGAQYLQPIFTNAIGADDVDHVRTSLFRPSNLMMPYHSINVDIQKQIHRLDEACPKV
jgi:6-phosphofructokinase 1